MTRLLQTIPITTGINLHIVKWLGQKLCSYSTENQKCLLLFDEISLGHGLTYDKSNDKIVGYVDLGHLGRFHQEANHALVFMLVGINGYWKQPIAFYFTKDQVKTIHLKQIIKAVISCLLDHNINVMGCVCDQGTVTIIKTHLF